ncbi:hypothetical protein ACQ4LF_25500, partial [Aeromonas salmonicida]
RRRQLCIGDRLVIVQMALLRTLLSALLALPLACLARHCWPLRLLFNLLRSVPELIFASLLVILSLIHIS